MANTVRQGLMQVEAQFRYASSGVIAATAIKEEFGARMGCKSTSVPKAANASMAPMLANTTNKGSMSTGIINGCYTWCSEGNRIA